MTPHSTFDIPYSKKAGLIALLAVLVLAYTPTPVNAALPESQRCFDINVPSQNIDYKMCIALTGLAPTQNPEYGKDFTAVAKLEGQGFKPGSITIGLTWGAQPVRPSPTDTFLTRGNVISTSNTTITVPEDGRINQEIRQVLSSGAFGEQDGNKRVGVSFSANAVFGTAQRFDTLDFTFSPRQVQSSDSVDISARVEEEFLETPGLRYNFEAIYYPANSSESERPGDVSVLWFLGDSAGPAFNGWVFEYEFAEAGDYLVKVEIRRGENLLAQGSKTVAVAGVAETGVGTQDTGRSGGLAGTLLSVVNIILGAIIAFLRWIVWLLGTLIFVPLLNETMKLQGGDIAGGVILTGWTFVRDIVNMFFILFLIVIGFGTILKIESYNYKKLLVNLVIMALLVNFSLVIGRIIIQIADIAQFNFLPANDLPGQPSGTTGVNYLFKSLSTAHVGNILDGFRAFSFSSDEAVAATFTLVFQFILEFSVILTFGALAVFMLIRTVALWILLIVSPFAYALAVLPATSSISKKWWSNFIKYVLFAPIIAFFIRLTLELYRNGLQIFPELGTWLTGTDLIDQLQKLQDQPGGVSFGQALELGLIYIVILFFLWAGLLITRQMGIFGANAIVGLAERGLKAPFAYAGKGAWMGTKAAVGFGVRKLGKAMGVQLMPKQWIEGYKAYREKQIQKDIKETAQKARDRAARGGMFTSFGSPEDFYKKALNWQEIKRFGKNIRAGRFNVNKAWLEKEQERVAAEQKAGSMVTTDEYRSALNEEAELKKKQVSLQDHEKLLNRSLGGRADMSDEAVSGAIAAVLVQMRAEVKQYVEEGNNLMAEKIRGEIKNISDGVEADKTSVAYDKNGEVGKKISEALKEKHEGNQREQGLAEESLKQIGAFKESAKGKLATKEQKAQAFAAAKEIERDLEQIRPPLSYEARLAVSSLVSEEKKKLTGIDNAEELQAYLNDSIRQKDKYKTMAIMEKMADDYNDNEFANNTYIKDPDTGQTRNFTSDSKGMHEFREKVLQKTLGMGEQSALEFMGKLSYINESRNHYETARMVGVRNGRQYAYSEQEHATAALAEIAKKSPRDILSKLNRLGYGGEIQHPDGSREFVPSLLGLAIMKGLGHALASAKQFEHINPNAAGKLSDPKVIKIFQQYGVDPGALRQIQDKGTKGWNPSDVVKQVKSMMDKSTS